MSRGATKTPRILLVEDDLDDREAIAEMLELEGYEVDRSIDGADALSLASLRPPDLVVIDLAMPRMDGFEVAQRLREEVGLKRIPLVAVTGNTPLRGLGAFTEMFFKPIRRSAFLEFVRRALGAASSKSA